VIFFIIAAISMGFLAAGLAGSDNYYRDSQAYANKITSD
jgi:hypothetical protein